MASFAAQLKDKFLGLVDRVTGWGGCGCGCGTGASRDKDVPEATKLPNVQQVLLQNRLWLYLLSIILLLLPVRLLIRLMTYLLCPGVYGSACSPFRSGRETPLWAEDLWLGPID
jgi:hypothetical protein